MAPLQLAAKDSRRLWLFLRECENTLYPSHGQKPKPWFLVFGSVSLPFSAGFQGKSGFSFGKSGFSFWFQFWPGRRGWGIFASFEFLGSPLRGGVSWEKIFGKALSRIATYALNSEKNPWAGPPLQKCVGDFCCINFGGFCRGFSWRIFLGTFSHKNEKKSPKKKSAKKSVLPKTDPKNPRVHKILVRILGPEMAAPILWTPGKKCLLSEKMPSFCRKTSMSIKFLVLGGGGGGNFGYFLGGGECRFYFHGREDFSDNWNCLHWGRSNLVDPAGPARGDRKLVY